MTEDRIQISYLDEKMVEGKRINNYQQWLEQFKQCTKRNYDTDIGPLIREETMNGTEWDATEEKIQQDFLQALRPETIHQITLSEYRTELDKIKLKKTNRNI